MEIVVTVPISSPDVEASSQFLMVSVWNCRQVPNWVSELSRLKKHNKVLLLILFMSILFMNRIMERILCLGKLTHYEKDKSFTTINCSSTTFMFYQLKLLNVKHYKTPGARIMTLLINGYLNRACQVNISIWWTFTQSYLIS